VDDPDGRLVEVWLRYREAKTGKPAEGFAVCDAGDQNSRIQESFTVEVGERRNTSDRQDDITVSGTPVEASQAFSAFDSTDPVIYDESIPHQAFPDSGSRAKWLIFLGYVRWKPSQTAGQAGSFQATSATDRDNASALRAPIGAVAGVIQAAEGVLRLKNRTSQPSGVRSSDLVWVEGGLRAEGDARLFGGRLDLLDAQGKDQGVPLSLQRAGDNQSGGRQLRAEIGAAQAGANSFQIGPTVSTTYTPVMTVLDNGKVGIGTTTPGALLEVNGGDLLLKAAQEDPGDLIFQNSAGVQKGRIWSNPSAGAALFLASSGSTANLAIDSSGRVGIGTTTPDRAVTVQGPAGTYLNIKADGGGEEVLIGADSGGAIVSAMTAHDLQLRAGTNSTKMTVKADGKVGIATAAPACKLHVCDSIDGDASLVSSHVAVIENTSTGNSADVLALKIGPQVAGGANNFITFFASGNPCGRIEGDGVGGVSYETSGADFAECLPRLAEAEPLEAGDVVGVVEGKVTRVTEGAQHVSAITGRPAFVANARYGKRQDGYPRVALVGQVAVKVRGPVRAGDLIVPSGFDDGLGVAMSPEEAAARGVSLVVGTAWQSSEEAGIKRINTAVGLHTALLRAQQVEIERLRRRLAGAEGDV
jgi:hypothetical protein